MKFNKASIPRQGERARGGNPKKPRQCVVIACSRAPCSSCRFLSAHLSHLSGYDVVLQARTKEARLVTKLFACDNPQLPREQAAYQPRD